MLSAKQKKIASKAGDPNKIDAKDFAVLKAEKAKGRGMGLQDEQLPPGKMVKAEEGKMVTKDDTSEYVKRRKKLGGAGALFGAMGGGMVDPTMANYQKGGSVMARGSKLAKVRPTKLY